MRSSSTSKQNYCKPDYYNFHHFRWKDSSHCINSNLSSEKRMKTNKASTELRSYTSYYRKLTGELTKHKRLRCCHQDNKKITSCTTFASFILMISTFLLLTSNRAVHCQNGKLTVTEAIDFKDAPKQPSRSVGVKNCFSLQRKNLWPQAIMYDDSTASINIDLSKLDPLVLECLKGMYFDVILFIPKVLKQNTNDTILS